MITVVKLKLSNTFFKGVIRARMLKIGHFCLLGHGC